VQATLPANRAALERALAGNPVYRAWELLGCAIGEMQAGDAVGGDDAAPYAAPPQAPARRSRVELRDVLERIRGGGPFDTAEPLAAAAATADDDPGAAAPAGPAGSIRSLRLSPTAFRAARSGGCSASRSMPRR